MTTLIISPLLFMSLIAHEIVSSEALVYLSNFGVIAASLLLAGITVHEAHVSIRKQSSDMSKAFRSENRLIARIIAGPFIAPSNGKHRKG